MIEIKTHKKFISASNQDRMTDVTCVIYNARDMASSQRSIEDPMATT